MCLLIGLGSSICVGVYLCLHDFRYTLYVAAECQIPLGISNLNYTRSVRRVSIKRWYVEILAPGEFEAKLNYLQQLEKGGAGVIAKTLVVDEQTV